MDPRQERLTGMLFNHETTSKTDYKKYEFKELPNTKKEREKRKSKIRPDYIPVRHTETLAKWKDETVPFDLYLHLDSIARCDPRMKQKTFVRLGDPDREKVQKTRPRLVMTPAASLDDIEDPKIRESIIGDMYMSTVVKAQKLTAEVGFPVNKNVKSPLGDTYAPPKPCDLKKLMPPYVSTEWRKESVNWDRNQLRGYADPTSQFWLNSPLRYRVEREN